MAMFAAPGSLAFLLFVSTGSVEDLPLSCIEIKRSWPCSLLLLPLWAAAICMPLLRGRVRAGWGGGQHSRSRRGLGGVCVSSRESTATGFSMGSAQVQLDPLDPVHPLTATDNFSGHFGVGSRKSGDNNNAGCGDGGRGEGLGCGPNAAAKGAASKGAAAEGASGSACSSRVSSSMIDKEKTGHR